jgi:hypothetical protein
MSWNFFAVSRVRRAALTLAALVAVVGVSACDQNDPFRPVAADANEITTLTLAAFSTGAIAPTAIDFINKRAVRPELQTTGFTNFQLALDITNDGRVALLPVLSVLTPPGGASRIQLQKSSGAFEVLERAPAGGYASDSAVVTAPGETWVFRLETTNCIYGDPFFGKLIVDGVNSTTRRIAVRFLINRNCGYRDLTEGVPRN